MAEDRRFSRTYVKYIIKTPLVFYLFLAAGVMLFLYMTLSLKLDVMQTYDAAISGNTVTVSCEPHMVSDTVYLYSDKNEEIFKVKAEDIRTADGCIVFTVSSLALSELRGDVCVELVVGRQTLFTRIFVNAGKG